MAIHDKIGAVHIWRQKAGIGKSNFILKGAPNINGDPDVS